MSLAFVICVEPGPLEDQAVLLCRSIRRYAGRYRGAMIAAFQPRAGVVVPAATRDALDSLGVEFRDEPINTNYADCPYSNKIYASARAEQVLSEDVLVFLDSDSMFTGEPFELDLPAGVDGAALPVCNRRLGSLGPDDENDAYWRKLYELCGVTTDARVRTVIDEQSIRPYFNSGLVAARRDCGLFSRWKEDFEVLMTSGHIPPSTGPDGMDEFSLAATLGRAIARVRVLDLRYNYPLTWLERKQLPAPWREAQLEELVHVHYRFYFTLPGYLERVEPPLDPGGEVVRWLEGLLPLKPLHRRFVGGFDPSRR
jgi:hypothetical protein